MLKKIAITGNIASGKTTALNIFKEFFNAYTLNADETAHSLLKEDLDLKNQVIGLLGDNIFKNGQLDRELIADIVFKDIEKLKKLEKLIHPKVLDEIENQYNKIKNNNFKFFVVEIPLLFEIGISDKFDIILLLKTKDSIAKKRYKGKDYILRKNEQLSSKEIEKLSTYVIDNDQSINSLKEKIKKIINNI